jgi:Suppressor of fused protein (SUFU)
MVKQICRHYERCWGNRYAVKQLMAGPMRDRNPDFRILVFPPGPSRSMWTYATVGMSAVSEAGRPYGIEVHLFAPDETDAHMELLTALAYYHLAERPLGWGHTVSLGRPWYSHSRCSYGLISLPYLDGPELEWMGAEGQSTHFLWLIPITGPERNYVIEQGVEALERLFEETEFNYLDPERPSVV